MVPAIAYTQEDIGLTYVYRITEVVPASPESGMTYDPLVVTIPVAITDAGNGLLVVNASYPNDPIFDNTYEAEGSWIPEVTKVLDAGGRDLADGEFSFQLLDSTDNVLQTMTNAADGSMSFWPISYTETDIGQTYTYTIVEEPGTELGMTYDPMIVAISVTVEDAGEGLLTITPTYSPDTEFNNIYRAVGGWQPEISKVLSAGGRDLEADEFKFLLERRISESPETWVETNVAYNHASGLANFIVEIYTQEDIGQTYTYRITEVVPAVPEPGMVYDPMQVLITVDISDAGNGELTVTPTYPADTEFNNTYTASGSWIPEVS